MKKYIYPEILVETFKNQKDCLITSMNSREDLLEYPEGWDAIS